MDEKRSQNPPVKVMRKKDWFTFDFLFCERTNPPNEKLITADIKLNKPTGLNRSKESMI
jgi:hypothetical protein